MSVPVVRLQAQRHKRVQLGHPWIYSNEVIMDAETKALPLGALVEFRTHDKQFLGRGSFNAHCLIAGRIFSRKILGAIDRTWITEQIAQALQLRQVLFREPYYRLIHAEADGLPGLIVDRFDEHLSVQVNSAGMEGLWPQILEGLLDQLKPKSIVLRNDSTSRSLEGLERYSKVIYGSLNGLLEVKENQCTYFADLTGGQKTGWYFDQRDNHRLVADISAGKSVLDLYCHAGGFGLLAAKRGARSVLGVDASEAALALARKASFRNGVDHICTWLVGDVFEDLERRHAAAEFYDIVISDPPAFVKARKDIASGGRGYRKLTRLSAMVTAPGGYLFIASCSHNMELSHLSEQVALGLHDAKREGRILHTVFAAPDHPVHPHLPETSYLKGFLIKLDGM